MRLLLDTHVRIWACGAPERLSEAAREVLAEPQNDVFVSAASAWEIAIKRTLGRLNFPVDRFDGVLREMGFTELPMSVAHALAAGNLPGHHDDPFDRMLLAQARLEGLTLLSNDAAMSRYDVPNFTWQ
jgi:PIN domain nuclease of toxin-antitoxin system